MITNTSIRRPLKPWLLAILPAAVLAAAVGALAASARDDAPDAVTFTVFAVMTFGFFLALGAILLDRTPRPEENEDSIESQWTRTASSGAFFDLVIAMALVTFLTSVLDTAGVSLWPFVLLALGDFTTRLVVLRRRQS